MRCPICRKSITLFTCKCSACEKEFCIHHRLPEDHMCEADFHQLAHDKQKPMVKIEAPKVTKL